MPARSKVADGSNEWRQSPDKPNQSYLAWSDKLAKPVQIAKIIEDLMVQPPGTSNWLP
jgi:hypothetical protein